MLAVGTLISGYTVVAVLSEDRDHAVYEVKTPDASFHLKCYHYEKRSPRSERILSAAAALRTCTHRGLVRIQDAGRLDDGAPYIVTEPVTEPTLRAVLPKLAGTAPLAEILLGLVQLSASLAELHRQGVWHLDVHPDCVRWAVATDTKPTLARFTDSELAMRASDRSARLPTTVDAPLTDPCARVHYQGSEYLLGREALSDKTDVYAFAALAYQVLTGRPPFQGKHTSEVIEQHEHAAPADPCTLNPHLAPPLAKLLLSMLAKSPLARPGMDAVAQELERLRPSTTLALPSQEDGQTMYGSYRLGRRIAEGGIGIVYEAYSEQLGRRAAIKVLNEQMSRRPDIVERFLDEVRAANRVGHPSIVTILHADRTPQGQPYLVMEYQDGETLFQCLQANPQGLPPARAINVATQLADTLAAVHAKDITHRDLKPENVMLVKDSAVTGGERVKLLDFGIAKLRSAEARARRTVAGSALGTPEYMAPEQRLDASTVTDRADVYALGIVLKELLSGSRATDLTAPSVSIVRNLLGRMLAEQPERRPSMAEIYGELRGLRDTLSAPVHSSAGNAVVVPSSLGRGRVLVAGLALAAVAGGLIYVASHPPLLSPCPDGGCSDGADDRRPDHGPAKQHSPALKAPPEMVAFGGGEFAMGSATVATRPVRSVMIRPFAIDVFETTNEQFAAFLNEQSSQLSVDPGHRLIRRGDTLIADLHKRVSGIYYDPREGQYRVGTDAEHKPVVMVSWIAAEQYCQSRGKRLPTESEWELAAGGMPTAAQPTLRKYPWGDERLDCARVVAGRSENQECGALGGGPARVGSAAGDRTPEGVADLGGNVAEWVTSAALSSNRVRIMRGGDWARGHDSTRVRSGAELPVDAVLPNLGFRCAQSLSR